MVIVLSLVRLLSQCLPHFLTAHRHPLRENQMALSAQTALDYYSMTKPMPAIESRSTPCAGEFPVFLL
jgi:hypothetical protein